MLGTNKYGEFIEIADYDPLSDARTLQPIENRSMESVVLSSEANFNKAQKERAYREGLEYTKKEKKALRQAEEQKQVQKKIDEYNAQVLMFQRSALLNERLKTQSDELSLEKAILDFHNQPFNRSVMEDSGFTTVSARGRAHLAPITDYEKVLQSAGDTRHDVVTMPYNPLGGPDFSQDEILNQRTMSKHYAKKARRASDAVTEMQDGTEFGEREIYSDEKFGGNSNGSLGFNWDSLWNTAQESLQQNAEKALDNAIDQAINPNAQKSGTTTVTQTYIPGTSVSNVSMAISPQMQKYMLYGAIGLGAIAVLGIVARIAFPSK